jgi:hypothetical protein
MPTHSAAEGDDPKADELAHGDPSSTFTRALQFSVRSLLIVTTIVSICLAIGVHFAGVMFALAFAALVQVGMLLSADWLIRPENRRALAFVTASSWIVLGSALLVVGVREVFVFYGTKSEPARWVFAWLLIGIGILCYYVAAKRWRRLSRGMPLPQRDVNR